MTNAELIKALRCYGKVVPMECPNTDCNYNVIGTCERERMTRDAADALETAGQRIAELIEAVTNRDRLADDLNKYIWKLEAQMPKQGKWISDLPNELFANVNPWKCSVCGKHQHFREDYCPNCGAKMTKGEEK